MMFTFNPYLEHFRCHSLRISNNKLNNMQTLSQIVANDQQQLPQPQIQTCSKTLGRRRDSTSINGFYLKFVKCINKSSDGTVANYTPRHGHVAIEVYFLKDGKNGKKRAVLVPDINVIMDSLPSEKRKINTVTVINFKVKRSGVQDIRDVFFYEQLIYDAILAMYGSDVRIVTACSDFDVGCAGVGAAANNWFARRFNLARGVQGVAVLRRGIV